MHNPVTRTLKEKKKYMSQKMWPFEYKKTVLFGHMFLK